MLTQNRLKELLTYNKNTGLFFWNKNMENSVKKGALAGYLRGKYRCIRIDKKNYSSHRLALDWDFLLTAKGLANLNRMSITEVKL